ncbi:beta-hydroxyacyl-ACP dehydratase, partial [Motilibacter sp. E257]
GALLWLESLRSRGDAIDGTLIFAAARDVVFHRQVLPGDTVRHVAHMERVVGDNAFLNGETWVGDELVATVGSAIAVRRPAGTLKHVPASRSSTTRPHADTVPA